MSRSNSLSDSARTRGDFVAEQRSKGAHLEGRSIERSPLIPDGPLRKILRSIRLPVVMRKIAPSGPQNWQNIQQ